MVGTRVLTPAKAVAMAAVLNLVGVLVTGSAVAATIGKGVVRSDAITLETLAAAMLTVVVWTMAAWLFGIPTSETHELLAGLAGAGLATAGPSVLALGWLAQGAHRPGRLHAGRLRPGVPLDDADLWGLPPR